MATGNTQINNSDPAILRQLERQTATILIRPAAVPGTVPASGNITTTAGAVRNLAPVISGNDTVFPQSTTATSNNSVTVTSSINNDSGDITTVYATDGAITVNPINQTINQYTAVDSGVSQILAGNGITVTSTGNSGTGVVTVSASAIYSNSNVAAYLPTYTGNIGANVITATLFAGNGSSLSAIAGANVTGFVPNANIANTAFAVAGANVSGQVANALVAGTVYTAAQPNITSVGSLTALTVTGNAVIGGDLTVNGNLVYVNVETLAVEDPIIQLQSGPNGAAPTANSGKDVGTGLNYYDTQARVAFMGWDVSNAEFGMASQASITSEVVTFTSYGNLRVGNIIGNGQALTSIAGANVTGFVPNANVANTAFAVAAANVSGLGNIATINLDGNVSNLLTGNGTYVAIPVVPTVGNIATINLDGNASNVLRGDGTFSADANSSYGNSNVVSLLSAFGSNTIVTTGIITADGANLSNVPYANLTGAPSLGNISSINLDGNVSNLLTGNGTYVAIPTVPTVGNIATINLDGNSQTWLAGNGVFANIAIPSVGNIATLNLDGSSSNVLYGNGVFAAAPGGSYGDSNVSTLLGAFGSNSISTTGNVTANNFSGNTNGFTIGYLDVPQVSASNTTLAATDAGKHYYSTTAGNVTLTIPLNSSVPFTTGTAISIVVQAAGNILVNAASGVTLYMAGNSSAANRVVGSYGMATLLKVATDAWFINGTGVS